MSSLSALAQSGRDYIYVVGSSTVYPFSTVVAERFGRGSEFKTPKVESTGSGGGLKLFCDGIGVDYPDIANASRAIKASSWGEGAGRQVTAISSRETLSRACLMARLTLFQFPAMGQQLSTLQEVSAPSTQAAAGGF